MTASLLPFVAPAEPSDADGSSYAMLYDVLCWHGDAITSTCHISDPDRIMGVVAVSLTDRI
jgi:hypothetical protein